MSRIVVTLAVEDAAVGPLGTKEAVAMALEPLGGVRVLAVELHELEQIRMVPNSGNGKER